MSDKDSTLFIGDSDPTCPAGVTPQPDGYVSGQSHQQTYQKFSCSRIDMYLGNILPEWPIFTPDEVLAMRQKYLAGQGSDNDRLSMLVVIDLADTMNPFHSQDIQELQFSLRYRRTIQTHALLALYWKRRGFHGFANEHITKAVALGSSSRFQWENSRLEDHFADIVALWCCCFIISEYPIHTDMNPVPPSLYKYLPLPSKDDIVQKFGTNAGAFFELRVAYISPRLTSIPRPQLECLPLELVKVPAPLVSLKNRYINTHALLRNPQQSRFTSLESYIKMIQEFEPANRRWAFPTERFCLYQLTAIYSDTNQRSICILLVERTLKFLDPVPDCLTIMDVNSIWALWRKLWAVSSPLSNSHYQFC